MSFDPFKFMGMLGRGEQISDRSNALNVDTGKYTVDTCECFDTGKWETGIDPDNKEHWVIVEYYEDKEDAIKGHAVWVKLMEDNPNMELNSVQDYGDDEDEDDE